MATKRCLSSPRYLPVFESDMAAEWGRTYERDFRKHWCVRVMVNVVVVPYDPLLITLHVGIRHMHDVWLVQLGAERIPVYQRIGKRQLWYVPGSRDDATVTSWFTHLKKTKPTHSLSGMLFDEGGAVWTQNGIAAISVSESGSCGTKLCRPGFARCHHFPTHRPLS
jgi:hypothetical protein